MSSEKDCRNLDEYKDLFQNIRYAKDYNDYNLYNSLSDFLNLKKIIGYFIAKSEVRAVRNLLSKCEVSLIVDIPCGAGKLFPLYDNMTVIGIDSSEAMLSQVTKRNNIKVIKGDIRNIPLPDNYVDMAICHRFLHRIKPRLHEVILKEIFRVTKKYAILYYSVKGPFSRFIFNMERLFHIGTRGNVYYMTENDIIKELEKLEWDILTTRTVLPFGISTGFLVLLKKGISRK